MSERIVVINPNCNEQVTAGMGAALEGFRFADGPAIDCATLSEGPSVVDPAQAAVGMALTVLRSRARA